MRSVVRAPLPDLCDLITALSGVSTDNELAAPWLRAGDSAYLFSRSSWSLAVIAMWRLCLTKKKVVHVWLPDYFCNSALTPLRNLGAEIVFYPITEQMSPALEACHRLAKNMPIDLFVLTHYFGQATPAKTLAAFCEQHRAWLIEDATHVLRPVQNVGEFGDFVLYSPHKHLPIPDGAVMVVRLNGPSKFEQNFNNNELLVKIQANMNSLPGKSSRTAMIWLFKRLAQSVGVRAASKSPAFYSALDLYESFNCHPAMSVLAKRLLKPMLNRLQSVAMLRERNALIWAQVLNWVSVEAHQFKLITSNTPYLAGFTAGNEERTEALFCHLRNSGLPVTTWPDLPPEVMQNFEDHSVCISLRNKFFYLPVHQSLSKCQLLAFGKVLARSKTAEWRVRSVSKDEWEEYWSLCSQTNVLQSWEYGAVKQKVEGWLPLRLLISDGDNRPVALVQALTKGIPILGYLVRINRGPIFLNKMLETNGERMCLLAIKALVSYANSVQWRILQIAPELVESSNSITSLQALGFNKVASEAWSSGRLELDQDKEELLMRLKGKWRNCLRKAEKLGVRVIHKGDVEHDFNALVKSYIDLQKKKRFDGISSDMLLAMAKQSGKSWQFNLFTAYLNSEEEIGHLVTIKSGDTALYLIGSVSEKGRKHQANTALLWYAILHAKKSDCRWFDMGGIAGSTPKGIVDFKLGTNPILYKLVGEWRKYIL